MANVSLVAISVIDFVTAILLVWSFPGNFMLVVSLFILIKGIWSMVSSLAAGFYYDVFGFVDFLAGIFLIIINFGTPIEFAWILGVIVALKGAYTLLTSI